jgi:hypothetical protein
VSGVDPRRGVLHRVATGQRVSLAGLVAERLDAAADSVQPALDAAAAYVVAEAKDELSHPGTGREYRRGKRGRPMSSSR